MVLLEQFKSRDFHRVTAPTSRVIYRCLMMTIATIYILLLGCHIVLFLVKTRRVRCGVAREDVRAQHVKAWRLGHDTAEVVLSLTRGSRPARFPAARMQGESAIGLLVVRRHAALRLQLRVLMLHS